MTTTIAIAGGTGGVGRTILEVLKKHPEYTAIVLSRNTSPERETEIGARIVATDYDNEETLAKLLEEHDVSVVISTMPVYNEGDRDTQIRLVRAADRAGSVKRFIPSDFSYPDNNARTSHIPVLHWKRAILDALHSTTTPLEHASFKMGFFMDYFGMPHCHTHLKRIVIAVDALNNFAGIPGDGTANMTFTNSFDVATVLVNYLSKPPGTWQEFVEVYGDKMSWNKMVEVLEEAKGVRFTKVYDKAEDVREKKATVLPYYEGMGEAAGEVYRKRLAVMGPHMAEGDYDVDIEARATRDAYPEGFVPMKMDKFLRDCWTGK